MKISLHLISITCVTSASPWDVFNQSVFSDRLYTVPGYEAGSKSVCLCVCNFDFY